jgi:4-hydroxy-tetrahydrodipicolinate reductase
LRHTNAMTGPFTAPSIAVAGAAGRMGQAVIRAALDAGIPITGASERADSPALSKDPASLAGREPIGVAVTADISAAAAAAAVWIDFTTPAASLAALDALPASVAAVVLGTTGFSPNDQAAIDAHAKARAIVQAGNFSLGVALLCALVRDAAARLNAADWDIEITEAHHRRKVDAPSGTALMLGRAAAAGRGVALPEARLAPHDGQTGPRPPGGIGFAVVRGGGIIGDHSAIFAAEREVLTLNHVAMDRAVFADGALAAARWAVRQPAGLYSISDVLGL